MCMLTRCTSFFVRHPESTNSEGMRESSTWVQSLLDALEGKQAHLGWRGGEPTGPPPALQPHYPEHPENTRLSVRPCTPHPSYDRAFPHALSLAWDAISSVLHFCLLRSLNQVLSPPWRLSRSPLTPLLLVTHTHTHTPAVVVYTSYPGWGFMVLVLAPQQGRKPHEDKALAHLPQNLAQDKPCRTHFGSRWLSNRLLMKLDFLVCPLLPGKSRDFKVDPLGCRCI